jgi:uncharacterized protein YbjT (DUF2867 family)
MRILVLGGTEFIGARIVETLVARGEVTIAPNTTLGATPVAASKVGQIGS